jgi:hypothetical protein
MSLRRVWFWQIIILLNEYEHVNLERTYERENPSGAMTLLEIVRLVVGFDERKVRGYDCDREMMDAAYVVESNVNAIKVEKYILQNKIAS